MIFIINQCAYIIRIIKYIEYNFCLIFNILYKRMLKQIIIKFTLNRIIIIYWKKINITKILIN